jgi:hypothetical protein
VEGFELQPPLTEADIPEPIKAWQRWLTQYTKDKYLDGVWLEPDSLIKQEIVAKALEFGVRVDPNDWTVEVIRQ